MKAAGLPYSGSYDWMPTRMYWKVNHEVAPKESAPVVRAVPRQPQGRKDLRPLPTRTSRDVDFKKLAPPGHGLRRHARQGAAT